MAASNKLGWLVGALAFTLNLGVVTVGATWAIGAIRTSTAELRVEVSNLSRSMDRFTMVLDKVEADGSTRDGRLGVLETRVDIANESVAELRARVEKLEDRE